MRLPAASPPAAAFVLTLAAAAAAGLLSAACGAPRPPGTTGRALSCTYDYENERFGGLLFLFDQADASGHFDYAFAGGPVETAAGDVDLVTGDFSMTETWRAGYASVTRDTTGNVVFEADGDGGGSTDATTTYADATVKTTSGSFTRDGCTVTSTRTDDEGTVTVTASTMVSAAETAVEQTATRTDGTVVTTTGSGYLDWSSDVHVERDDPTVAQAPDYVEDRTGNPDGSGSGDYAGWYMNGQYEEGTAAYYANGDVVRTWTRYTDDTAATVFASGTTTVYQDTSGMSAYTYTNAMGMNVSCTRTWGVAMAGCMTACDDGTNQAC
jgi:hypothetical protein